jgi:hypothetical protein
VRDKIAQTLLRGLPHISIHDALPSLPSFDDPLEGCHTPPRAI